MNRPSPPIFWLGLPVALAAPAVPASAQVYLTESQALAIVLGEGVNVKREQKSLSESDRRELQDSSGLRFPEQSFTFFLSAKQGKVVGYAVVLDEIGKSEPITFMVGMSPGGKVTEVAVMAFRESRGWEVKEKRFLRQFRGKTVGDPIRVDQDILNYTGATLSSKALARGVKRALLLLNKFYSPAAQTTAPQGAQRVPLAPSQPIAGSGDMSLYRQARMRMGTPCEIRVWCSTDREAPQAFAAGFAELERIEQVFSHYREDSELAGVNRQAARRPVEISAEFFSLTRFALDEWRRSRGAFDLTVAPLVKAWGFFGDGHGVPSAVQLAEARARVGSDLVKLDARARTIRFLRDGMELDFGGLVKGYAARRAARLAGAAGVRCAERGAPAASVLVNLGGSSLAAAGAHPMVLSDASPRADSVSKLARAGWPVGIANPLERSRLAQFLELAPGWSLSTSGTYEQRFSVRGRTFSHLIDPRAGWPVETTRSATVIARAGARTETLAKRLVFEHDAAQYGLRGVDWVTLEAAQAGLAGHLHLRNTVLLIKGAAD